MAEIGQAGVDEPAPDFERLPDGAESYRLRVRVVGDPISWSSKVFRR